METIAAERETSERQSRALRRDALRSSPRCGVELMHAARALKIDLVAQPELAFLAEMALCINLPAGWVLVTQTATSGAVAYRNVISGTVTTTHPLEAFAQTFTLLH